MLMNNIGHLLYDLLKQSLSDIIREDRAALHKSLLHMLKGHIGDNHIPPMLRDDEKRMTSLTGKKQANWL